MIAGALFALGWAACATARRLYIRHRMRVVERLLAEHQARAVEAFRKLASQALADLRPTVPSTWNEMVDAETAPLPEVCICGQCPPLRAVDRKAVN
jgi:hypothetical protein